MKNLTKSILFTALITTLALGVFPAAAQIKPIAGNDCKDLGINCNENDNPQSLVNFIYKAVNVFLILVGITAAIFLVIGGVRYIFSQGDSEDTQKAKRTILYAIIGLIVIGLSAAIVNFILGPPGGGGGIPAGGG